MMSQHQSASTMMSSLTSLLKQVRLFGYSERDSYTADLVEENFSPASGFASSNASSSSLSSCDTDSSTECSSALYDNYNRITYSHNEFNYEDPLPNPAPKFHFEVADEKYSMYGEKTEEYNSGSLVPAVEGNQEMQRSDLECSRDTLESRAIQEISDLPEYSLGEVALHDSYDDCWMVFYDKIYDVTRLLDEHPGGVDVLMEHAGRDATLAFRGVGHSKSALRSLKQYIIGVLPLAERIFSSWQND